MVLLFVWPLKFNTCMKLHSKDKTPQVTLLYKSK